jgi:hypothetical protein
MNINTKYLDVDFTDRAVNQGNLLGCQVRDDLVGESFPLFEDAFTLYPESEWAQRIARIEQSAGWLERVVAEIMNQGREGSCASNATVQAQQVIEAIQAGRNHVVLKSAISLYKQVGRSAGSGSTIGGNLRALAKVGILPRTVSANERFAHTMPHPGFSRRYPGGWETTAAKFRAEEWFEVTSLAGMVTACLMGFPCVYGRDRHAIVLIRVTMQNGRLVGVYANSWGDWGATLNGMRGFGFDSRLKLTTGASRYGCFALRATRTVL